ncbi:MAG: glycosyltransferase family 4 protein [Saprospiraceae bacterium]
MRILFVVEHFYPYIGGAEHLFWVLSRALVEEGHEVRVITTRFRSDLPREESIEGVQIRRIDCGNRFLFSVVSLPTLLKEVRHYDLIQTTSYNAALPAFIASVIGRKPVVITFHEVWGRLWFRLPKTRPWLQLAYYLWEQLLLRLPFDRFIAVSDATESSLQQAGVPDKRTIRIYNGLDYKTLEPFRYRPPQDFVVTYYGRLGTSKGLDLLLPAMADFLQSHPEAVWKLIIPRVPDQLFQWVMSTIHQMPAASQVQLLHDLDRDVLLEEVSTSTCVVVPSYSEGFCFVAAEAVAMGVPVISSHQTALKEVVGGQMIRMGRMDVHALRESLERAHAGQWESAPVRRFDLKDSIRQYSVLYDQLRHSGK